MLIFDRQQKRYLISPLQARRTPSAANPIRAARVSRPPGQRLVISANHTHLCLPLSLCKLSPDSFLHTITKYPLSLFLYLSLTTTVNFIPALSIVFVLTFNCICPFLLQIFISELVVYQLVVFVLPCQLTNKHRLPTKYNLSSTRSWTNSGGICQNL